MWGLIGVHMLHIALNGYEHEKQFAFWPLFPFAMRSTATALLTAAQSLGVVACHVTLFKVAGVCINFVAFVIAATALYQYV